MLPFTLTQIDAATFQSICDQRFSESATIDFKQKLTGNDDKGKNEFAKDVCAMANADGGDLVYGIEEEAEGGTAKSIRPLTGESYDDASRRLLQTLDAWVEPRLQGIELKRVELEGGYGLVVRVPASFDGPHCVRNSNSQRRFVLRNGTVTSDMTYDQIRNAFVGTASLATQARAFVESRHRLVGQAATQTSNTTSPIAICEFVPLAGIANRTRIDVKTVDYVDFVTWDGGANPRINLDGVGAILGSDGEVVAQSQLFRNGSMEYLAVTGSMGSEGRMGVASTSALDFFERCLSKSLKASVKYSISGPALVSCALFNLHGSVLFVRSSSMFRSKPADRHTMIFPEIFIEDVSSESTDVKHWRAELADVLYQAFGYRSAPTGA